MGYQVNESTGDIVCVGCGYAFGTRGEYLDHECQGPPDGYELEECPYCGVADGDYHYDDCPYVGQGEA